jgi:hypothetical protein
VTIDLVEQAAELRRDGLGVEAIAKRLGLSLPSTFRALALARDDLPKLPALPGPGLDEPRLVARVQRAAVGDWRTAAWLHERVARERRDRAYRPPGVAGGAVPAGLERRPACGVRQGLAAGVAATAPIGEQAECAGELAAAFR